MQEERGRTLERKGPGYSRWTDTEKVSVPGLPMFVPDVLSEAEMEALILRYRIDEIGHKLAQNLLDLDLRARYVCYSILTWGCLKATMNGLRRPLCRPHFGGPF